MMMTYRDDITDNCCDICGISEYHKHTDEEMFENVVWRDKETGEFWNFGMEEVDE
jgi:hypothetical protein